MLTQEQVDKLNERVGTYEETRIPFCYIALDDLADILGLELGTGGHSFYRDIKDFLSIPDKKEE